MININCKSGQSHIGIINRNYKLVILILLITQLIISCDNQHINTKKPRFLFSLPLGTLPGEFKHWHKKINSITGNTLIIRDGVFYIGNGNRVLKLSSNGYLLDFIANYPIIEDFEDGKKIINTNVTENYMGRNDMFDDIPYYQYPLYWVSNLAVDSQNRLLIANTLLNPYDYNFSFDQQNGGNTVSLLVYQDNKVQYNIVREGEEKNFNSVVGLYTKHNDNIVLISKDDKLSYTAYIMDKEGRLIKKILFPYGQFPRYTHLTDVLDNSDTESNMIFGIIKTIVPSNKRDYLYVQFEYYKRIYDIYGESLSQIDILSSRIYLLNINTGEYEKVIEIPSNKANGTYFTLYNVLSNESLILASYIDERIQDTLSNLLSPHILVMTASGKIKQEYYLELPMVEFFNLNFGVDNKGNIGAFFLLKDRVEVYWW